MNTFYDAELNQVMNVCKVRWYMVGRMTDHGGTVGTVVAYLKALSSILRQFHVKYRLAGPKRINMQSFGFMVPNLMSIRSVDLIFGNESCGQTDTQDLATLH